MIQCPECRQLIPDDSAYCDQCGKVLMWCPVCKRPKRGTECPVCGNDLVPGPKYLAGDYNHPSPSGPAEALPSANNKADAPGNASPAPSGDSSPSPLGNPPASSVMPGADRASQPATKLVGSGWTLALQEGPFGRRGGIWPELASCQYVSGSHGSIGRDANGWTITDIGSTNGTKVNDVRLAPGVATPIKKGDRVKIATLDFTVE